MKEQEAKSIALDFWAKQSDISIVEVIANFREDGNYWVIILKFDSENSDDFVAIIVEPNTKEATIFQTL